MSSQATLEKVSADQSALSAAPAIPVVSNEWKLAWEEFRGSHPRVSKLPGHVALVLFTILGLSPLAIASFLRGLLLPWYVWVIEPLVLMVLAQIFTSHYSGVAYRKQIATITDRRELDRKALEGRIAALEKRFEPVLQIVFTPHTPPYEELYFEDLFQFRVGVVSPIPIPNAEVVVNKLYVGEDHHDGLHLRPRHDRSPQGTRQIPLKPFKPEFWDVVSTPHWGVVLNNVPELGEVKFHPGNYEFELMASGGDSPPITKIVSMEVTEDYAVRFDVKEGRLSEAF